MEFKRIVKPGSRPHGSNCQWLGAGFKRPDLSGASQTTITDAIRNIREATGDLPIVICSLTVAELAHGIYRADTPDRSRMRRKFLDELKAQIPIHPITDATAEINARVGANKPPRVSCFPWAIS
jgi:hypothetical protein